MGLVDGRRDTADWDRMTATSAEYVEMFHLGLQYASDGMYCRLGNGSCQILCSTTPQTNQRMHAVHTHTHTHAHTHTLMHTYCTSTHTFDRLSISDVSTN